MSNEIRKSSYKKPASTTTRRAGHRLTAKERAEAQERFLKAFAANGIVRAACLQANVDRATVRQWEEHDTDFSLKYNLAKEDVNDAIRGEIYRRGMFGDERYVTSMGKIVYEDIPVLDKDGKPVMRDGKQVYLHGKPLTYREKSDTLLIFHAKARMPEYRDKSQLDVKAQMSHAASDMYAHLSDEELDDVERILLAAQERMQHHD